MAGQEPALRILKIEVTSDGQAWIDGSAVLTTVDSSVDQARAAALRTAVDLAAAAGGALRVDARDPDGILRRLVVHPSGRIEDAAGTGAVPSAGTLRADQGTDDPTAERIPAAYLDSLTGITRATAAGGFEAADQLAAQVEQQIKAEVRRLHPQWVRIREVRADLSYRRGASALATEQWIEVARAWVRLGQPNSLTAARNAHHCWLLVDDPEDAVRLGQEVAEMWRHAGRAKQAQRAMLRLDRIRLGGR